MKKLLFFGTKNRSDTHIEINESKLHKQGFEIIYEANIKNLEKILTEDDFFYIIVDEEEESAINIIKESTKN